MRRIDYITKSLLVVLLMVFNQVYAEPTLIEKLKSFLANTRSLTASFKQVTIDENGQTLQTNHGLFYLSKPGKFRWNYQQPFVQEIVSNLGKVWFYDAELEQVIIKNLGNSLGSAPALLLMGNIALEENFTLLPQGFSEGMQWLKLSPKNKESSFNYILLGLTDDVLGGIELSNRFGQLTLIYFSDIKLNPVITDAIFEFTPPKGVDIFEN